MYLPGAVARSLDRSNMTRPTPRVKMLLQRQLDQGRDDVAWRSTTTIPVASPSLLSGTLARRRSSPPYGIESCQECLRLDPPNAQALYNLALACEHLGRFDEALSWVRRGLARDAKDVWLQQLELRIRVLRWRGRIVRALRTLLFRKA